MSSRTYRIEASTVSPASRTYSVSAGGPTFYSRTYAVSASAPETPQPNAGADIVDMEPWLRVPLSGTETSNVGPSIAQRWTQVSGTPVEILQAGTPEAYYWAPGSTDGESLVFGYQVQGVDETWSPVDTVKHRFLPSAEFAAVGGRLVPMGVIEISSGYSLGTLTK